MIDEIIYKNLKNGIISNELLPIKNELLFILKKTNIDDIYALYDLVQILFKLKKEKKLSLINYELISFSKNMQDDNLLPSFISAITYNFNRMSHDVSENINICRDIGIGFYGSFIALEKNYNNFNYLNKYNNVFANISVKYQYLKEKLISNTNYKVIDMYVLSNVLEIIATICYINIADYEYDYDLINRCMMEIEDNIVEYFTYFASLGLWTIDIGITPKSIGGYLHEFIVIGNIVNNIYKKNKEINLSR